MALAVDHELLQALAKERALFSALSLERIEVDLVEGIHARIRADPTPPEPRRICHPLGLAALLAAATLVVWSPSGEPEPPAARAVAAESAARWMGVRVFLAGEDRPIPVLEQVIPSTAQLVLSYTNLGPRPARSLMVFGVDSTQHIRWYYPAWTDEKTNPRAIRIESRAADVLLSEAVRHALPVGPLELHALFLDDPLTVRDAEARWTRDELNVGTATHQIIRLEVR